MNKSSPRGVKLTTVIFAVLVLAVSAILSGNSVADDMEVKIETSEQ
jgi:hypothetical protein